MKKVTKYQNAEHFGRNTSLHFQYSSKWALKCLAVIANIFLDI